jgi:hypothetical protein
LEELLNGLLIESEIDPELAEIEQPVSPARATIRSIERMMRIPIPSNLKLMGDTLA